MSDSQEVFNQLADRLMNRALDINPTVRVANGKPVAVSVNTPVTLRAFEAVRAEQRYVRW
jgi:type IV secretory pathway VirB10-like protein